MSHFSAMLADDCPSNRGIATLLVTELVCIAIRESMTGGVFRLDLAIRQAWRPPSIQAMHLDSPERLRTSFSLSLPAETSDSRWGGGSSAPSSAAAGGSRPRLNLKPRSADLPATAVAPPPAEAPPSEAGSDDKDREPLVMPRTAPRSNPFGGAKPIDVKELPEPSKCAPPSCSAQYLSCFAPNRCLWAVLHIALKFPSSNVC